MGQFLIAVLILLSMVLTLAVPFPTVSEEVIATILIGGSVVAIAAILPIEFLARPSRPIRMTSLHRQTLSTCVSLGGCLRSVSCRRHG